MPDSPVPSGLGEAQVVVDLPDLLEVVMISLDDEPIEEHKDHLSAEDDPEEDLDLKEQQVDQAKGDVESEASVSSFDLSEEPNDDSDLDYDPSRDRWVVLGVDFSRLYFESCLYIARSVWMDAFCVVYGFEYSKVRSFRL